MKMLFSALSICLLSSSLTAYAAEQSEFKVIVSENPPAAMLVKLESFGEIVDLIDGFGISTKMDGVFDYGLAMFSKKTSVTPDIPDAYALISLTPVRDESGKVVPEQYKSAFVGLVFVEDKVAWFASEEARKIFIKATE